MIPKLIAKIRTQPARRSSLREQLVSVVRRANPRQGERWLVVGSGSTAVAELLRTICCHPCEILCIDSEIHAFSGSRSDHGFLCFDFRTGLAPLENEGFDGVLIDGMAYGPIRCEVERVLRNPGRVITWSR